MVRVLLLLESLKAAKNHKIEQTHAQNSMDNITVGLRFKLKQDYPKYKLLKLYRKAIY